MLTTKLEGVSVSSLNQWLNGYSAMPKHVEQTLMELKVEILEAERREK
jgi:hypothetical protein